MTRNAHRTQAAICRAPRSIAMVHRDGSALFVVGVSLIFLAASIMRRLLGEKPIEDSPEHEIPHGMHREERRQEQVKCPVGREPARVGHGGDVG
eukprot:CAMPEP_0119379430 /NCGR_PEP_ID=MMETSP1334-20130426/52631_1 /TAXON_ID=127549 /ORGANISM="Calcidiscus leptoporus, Strain RCC1130" /LENGTH=93 /DNA_ID=CAMNT_0007398931 /DNA_START=23 /DNA_END=304 /DNA_ORIENTATION=+